MRVVYKLENDISTDVIYPGRFMATVLPTETPEYAFYDDQTFNDLRRETRWNPSKSVIVAGTNFGCGSSREQAVSTLAGLTVVAKSFARIFHQNAINLGLNIVECPDIEANKDDKLEISLDKIKNLTTGKEYDTIPLPKASQDILDAGGLIPHTRAILAK
jgi:3-isopropylmalate/(R)-2-methylmalate dehydratase small subunit